ncbi:MAG: hypothetical protein M0R80_02350 [Proteobacteria bacterium]|jgi:hypothetical protein|nr:hypothetical protein [Pseudomonadota bacterium]
MNYIFENFPVTNQEYEELEDNFGKLSHYQAWQLYFKNTKNNHTDEQEDIVQDLKISLLTAGTYFKRQTYIEKCLKICKLHITDRFLMSVLDELQNLWNNKTRHGASRQKFGPHQEQMLTLLVSTYVPDEKQPSKQAPLKIDAKFKTYCKSISWNRLKAMGKKITKEKSIRAASVSLSEFDYLGGK